jgi:Asp-tRNA(Asn)/Glu-tRNA(Gln) amidotransferase C subunit
MRLINAKLGIEKNNSENFEKQLSYVLDLVDNIRRITETKDSTTTTIETTINNRNQYTKFGNLNLSYDSNGNLKQKGEILIRKR